MDDAVDVEGHLDVAKLPIGPSKVFKIVPVPVRVPPIASVVDIFEGIRPSTPLNNDARTQTEETSGEARTPEKS